MFFTEWRWTTAVIDIALASVLAYLISKRLGRPLEEISREAQLYAQGDFTRKISIAEDAPQEIRSLADSLNETARVVRQKMQTIEEKHQEVQSILSSMVEAVISVDQEGRILHLNKAGKKLFKITPGQAQGKLLQEVIRVLPIHDLFQKILQEKTSVTEEIVFADTDPPYATIYLRAQGTPLLSPRGDELGAMVVLHDESKLHHLENHRKEFVANVSHELRTPLTSIKGLMEILKDGPTTPSDTQRFYETILRNVERLNALVEDLLSLAQLDREEIQREVAFEPKLLRPVLDKVHDICALKLSRKKMKFTVDCPEALKVMMNESLLEMALINLLDNAAKYGHAEGAVTVWVESRDHEVIVNVSNQGPNIPKELEERVFERFYRVDKSRQDTHEGGTGLGLSIVKHVALIHRGQAGLRSTPQGPVFWLTLPLA